MKKIIFILFILTALLSCKKVPFDYRNKFIGNYEFTSTLRDNFQCCQSQQPCCMNEVVEVFKGSIDYGLKRNSIIVDLQKWGEIYMYLDQDGSFISQGGYYGWNGHIDDKGVIKLWYVTSGLGSGYYFHGIVGEKIK